MRVLSQLKVVCCLAAALAARSAAQAKPDSAACERILSTARVDSIESGLFISARDVDGDMAPEDERQVAQLVGSLFTPPKPLRLSVFAGPARTHILRPIKGDTGAEPRAPSVTSVIRVTTVKGDTALHFSLARASLIVGFDSALVAAIRDASVVRGIFMARDGDDTLRMDVRMSTDSLADSRRLFSAYFPRLPIVDAVPLSTPSVPFPVEAKADSLDRGEVVFRMVVGRDGTPELATVEVIRATSPSFVKAAYAALPHQRFRPATVQGCAVPQVIDYPFAFMQPESPVRK